MAENPRIEELRRRVQADPASIAFAALAEEFRRVGRFDDAVETCRTGLVRHPAYLSARVTLGRALIETGDFEGAREQLKTVLRTAPENLVAIRALAEIDERLGHSAKMDPQVADAMKTMQEEALRASFAVEPAPAPPPVTLAPEPPKPIAAETPPNFENFDDVLGAELDASQESPVDPFASFAPRPTPVPVQDLSFSEQAFEVLPVTPREAPAEFDLATDVDPEPASEPEPEPVDQIAAASGPDPGVLATIARLERLLGAIESLRA
jgi:tetratricopeptide (TPR) repeat protein